ncbi:MAG: DegV family protein [Bacilli bacterium]|nr:DegV family protein [Bacilli bacterium]
MKIAISCDSSIDITKEQQARFDIRIVPFTLIMGEDQGFDGEITPEALFAYTKKTGKLPHTAAVNEFQMEEHFEKLLKEFDHIIHFDISSELSSAYKNACLAAVKFPGKVTVIDSRVLSTGIALLAIYARRLADAGYAPEEIEAKVKERIPFDQTSFVLESVDHLYKGGRCSALAMFGANLLKLRPEIFMKDGVLGPGAKLRGPMKKFVADYVADTLKTFNNIDPEVVFVTYSTCEDKSILEATEQTLKERGFKEVLFSTAGGTVSTHCGPHCLGILYLNDGPHPIEKK